MESEDCGRNLKKSSRVCDVKKRRRKRKLASSSSNISINMDMAQARREIFNALQLHRSSSSSSPAVSHPAVSYSNSTYHHQQQQQQAESAEVVGVEWFDHVTAANSYTWWIAFLTSLDRKVTADHQSPPSLPPGESGSDSTDPNPITDQWVVFPPPES